MLSGNESSEHAAWMSKSPKKAEARASIEPLHYGEVANGVVAHHCI